MASAASTLALHHPHNRKYVFAMQQSMAANAHPLDQLVPRSTTRPECLFADIFSSLCLSSFFYIHLSFLLSKMNSICRSFSHSASKSVTVVYSGIQPTGSLHIGNYFGALTRWIQLQNDESNKCIYSIADLHAITLPWRPNEMKESIYRSTATILASGIDANKCILFQQSNIPYHCNLGWILSCLMTLPKLQGLPQFKDKSASTKNPNPGLLMYPVLQAADILLYKSHKVPVGADQMQQIHLCQHLVEKFNSKFGKTFPTPQPLLSEINGASRIKSLRDAEKKMSKSDPDAKSKINLLDSDDEICKKIAKSITDSTSSLSFDPQNRPGVSNLLSIHSAFTGLSIENILEEHKSLDTGNYKKVLSTVVIEHLKPIRCKALQLLNDPLHLECILAKGREKALEIAEPNMNEIMQRVGFK